MKRSFLKISATLLTLILAFSCFAFSTSATGEPTISVIGNNQSPAAVSATGVTVGLSGTNLSAVKGIDLTLNAPSGASFKSMSGSFKQGSTTQITLTSGTNYTLTSSKIRIVATFVKKPVDTFSATITLDAPSTINEYPLSAEFTLVNGNVAKYTSGFVNNAGTLIVGKTTMTSATGSTLSSTLNPTTLSNSGLFVPYAGVFVDNGNGSYTYPKKNADGSFNLTGGTTYKYTKFRLPNNAGKITTFSSSKKLADAEYDGADGVQFVSYALNRSQNHGTVLFKGDFDALYEAKKGTYATKEELVQHYANVLMSKPSGSWGKITYAGGIVAACRVERVKAMWADSNNENGHIQYALRVLNVNNSEKYTAVGYTWVSSSSCNISDEYQSVTV